MNFLQDRPRNNMSKIENSNLSEEDFLMLQEVVSHKVGIILPKSKKESIYNKISKKMEALQLSSIKEYFYLINNNEKELEFFINTVTNTSTDFFREKTQFHYLAHFIIPQILKHKNHIKIWSAGCASGEEAYTIAMTIADSIHNFENYDIKILATDINTDALAKANTGIYSAQQIELLGRYKEWFHILDTHKSNPAPVDILLKKYQINDKVKKLIRFRKLNLLDPWPMKDTFDIIFFRNVSIYMTASIANALLVKFDHYLQKGGYLLLGAVESLQDMQTQYRSLGNSIFQKNTDNLMRVIQSSTGNDHEKN